MNGYPPAAFYFSVVFDNNPDSDNSFQEVTGIAPEITTEEYAEGGENRYIHQLPKAVKHPRLVLKRGVATLNSPLVKWCTKVLEQFTIPICPQSLVLYLLDPDGCPARSWSFIEAYPVKWEIESFNSKKNEVAIEKIEFCYAYSKTLYS